MASHFRQEDFQGGLLKAVKTEFCSFPQPNLIEGLQSV